MGLHLTHILVPVSLAMGVIGVCILASIPLLVDQKGVKVVREVRELIVSCRGHRPPGQGEQPQEKGQGQARCRVL